MTSPVLSARLGLVRYIRGWAVFWHAMRLQLWKRHGAGRAPVWQAVFFARNARWIAAQQHRPDLNPYHAGVLGDITYSARLGLVRVGMDLTELPVVGKAVWVCVVGLLIIGVFA
jgi:hypothetical protein